MGVNQQLYSFGSFRLDPETGVLYDGEQLVALAPKVAQTLVILVENHGKVVDKQGLLTTIWPDTFVEEGNLHHNISVLRKLLKSDGNSQLAIETLPKRGYRFLGDVVLLEPQSADVMPPDTDAGVTTQLPAPPEGGSPDAGRGWRWPIAAAAVILCAYAAFFLAGPRVTAGTERQDTKLSNSIAVLPFSNDSADPQMEYLSDGLTDELIHALTRVPNMRVVARTSSFQFKAKPVDLRQAGVKLQARMILEGSVQKDGDRLRVLAQLIDASTGLHVWSERFDRQFGDLFAIQDEICNAITSKLDVQFAKPAGAARNGQNTASLEVYTLYLRGLKEWNRRSGPGVRAARDFFERANAMDPNYAPAWAGLADTMIHAGLWGIVPAAEAFPKAKAAALHAIELDRDYAAPHTALGYIQGWYERNPKEAEASFRRALAISPVYSWGRERLASYLSVLGRHEEAITEFRRVLELDPISTSANSGMALSYFWARRYDRAIEQCARTRELDPQFPLTYYYLSHTLEQQHRYEESVAALETGTRLWGSTDGLMLAALYAAVPGRRAEGLQRLDKIKASTGGGSGLPYQMALIYAALGDKDTAFHWLDRASRQRDVWFLYANVDPRMDRLRGDRRFQELMQ